MATTPTQRYAINATQVASVPANSAGQSATYNYDRRWCYIRNYANSSGSIYVSFDNSGACTAGTNGELEIVPGSEYIFGGPLPPSTRTLPGSFYLPSCPPEQINVICTSGQTATGCVVTM